jgi:hypothetical protein
MKTRIIQSEPEPDQPPTSGNGAVTPPPPAHNLAARMARWSGRHRRKAIFGWLAFALVTFVVGMNVVGQKDISDLDQFSGEAGDAEKALDGAGLRPVEEVVFVQSDKLTIKDPEFRAAVEDVTGRISQVQYVKNVKSPLTGGGEVSADGHAALVNFEIAGDATEAADRVDPTLAAVAAAQDRHPNLDIEQFGGASADEAIDGVIQDDLAKAGMLSLPITLIILTITFGTLVAAGLPLLIGITSVMAALGLVAFTSHLVPADANLPAVGLLIGLAVGVDYSLFYLRREREERAAGRSERSALETAAATSGRAVLISGVTVIVAMAGMFISGDKAFTSFAEGSILVVAIAMFASLTVLPAMLSWLGDRVEKGRVPLLGRRRPAGQSRFWTALTGRHAAPGPVDRARRRAPGGAGDSGAPDEDRDQRHRRVPAGPPRRRDLQQGQGRVPDRGRHRDRGRRGRRRALRRRRRRHRRPARRGQGLGCVPARNRGHLQRRRHGRRDQRPDPGQRHRRPRPSTPSTSSATTSSRRRSAKPGGPPSTSRATPPARRTSPTS